MGQIDNGKFYLGLFFVALACIPLIPSLHPVWIILGSGLATVLWAAVQKLPQGEGE